MVLEGECERFLYNTGTLFGKPPNQMGSSLVLGVVIGVFTGIRSCHYNGGKRSFGYLFYLVKIGIARQAVLFYRSVVL